MPPACVGDVHCLSTLRRYANDSRIAWLDFLMPVVFVCLDLLATLQLFFIILPPDTYVLHMLHPFCHLCSGSGLAAPPRGVLHMIYYNTYMQYDAIRYDTTRYGVMRYDTVRAIHG